VIEIWRQPLRDEPTAAIRVLARSEAGADGPDEYAVGITTKADAHLFPMGDESDLFTGLSFAESHWLAAILVSATRTVEEAENLLFDLRMPVELTWRDIELAPEVIEPNGLRSQPLVPWNPEGPLGQRVYAIATYTLDCGHQAVELLRQDSESAPFWLEDGAVDHLDHASYRHSFGGKIGIDATAKLPEEGYTRGWPEVIRMRDDVKRRVDELWEQLGL